jgi:hypothetical protein
VRIARECGLELQASLACTAISEALEFERRS